MTVGELTDRITLLKPKQQTGPVVDLSESGAWEEYCKVWSKVEYLKGTEFFAAKAVNAETSIKFIVRYRKDITAEMAVQHVGKILNIISAFPLDNSRTWTIITANEVVTSG